MENDIMDLTAIIQKSIHEEIEYTISKNKNVSYQDAFNTCVVFRLAMMQMKINALDATKEVNHG